MKSSIPRTMINANEARRIILDAVPAVRTEKISLGKALGRTLAEDIVARENIPPFPNSSMDGYAVRRADLARASASRPVWLTVAGEASAGNVFHGALPARSAVRIMTGGWVPEGADSVVPVEQCRTVGDHKVAFSSFPELSAFIRSPGEDVAYGERVMSTGDLIGPPHLGVLASLGRARVMVARRPRVTIGATGDELVGVKDLPPEGCIRNSSSFLLDGLVRDEGGKPEFLGIAQDRTGQIKRLIRRGTEGDLLLVTGGVSVGKYDLVRGVLEDLGAEIGFWKVNIKPGKPLLFGVLGGTLVFGLPGNAVSTGVTFLQFVRPALRAMLGRPDIVPRSYTAVCDEPLSMKDGKRHFLRGVTRQEGGRIHVRTTGSQSSGMMSSLLKADCLIILPEDNAVVRPGAEVQIEFLDRW